MMQKDTSLQLTAHACFYAASAVLLKEWIMQLASGFVSQMKQLLHN